MKYARYIRPGDDGDTNAWKLTNSRWREKLLRLGVRHPYRKPTQVGGKRIARRTG